MGLLRRLSVSMGVAVSVAATLTIASVGAAGGFGQGTGKFTFTDTSAFANFFNPSDSSSLNLSVDRSLFMFRPRAGGPVQTQNMTVLSISFFVPDPSDPTAPPVLSETGCFVIPDTDFSVSPDLQSATLNATVDESNFCPGFLVPVTGAVADAKGGGGGGGGGFSLPMTVTASWTGTGAVGISDNQGTFRCDSFVSTTHNHDQSALSSLVAATISGLGGFSGGPEAFGSVSVNTNVQNVAGSGILSPACGGGKG